ALYVPHPLSYPCLRLVLPPPPPRPTPFPYTTLFRSPEDDPLAQDFVNRMPEGITVAFIDDWYSYHLLDGEVHCGTNVTRTPLEEDRKSTRLNSSHVKISYAVFCLKKKKQENSR